MADNPVLMTAEQLTEAVHGICLCDYSSRTGFSSVATDSRKVLPGSLFVPLMGEFQDGHTFITDALSSGASLVFVDSAHGEGSSGLYCALGKKYNAGVIMVEHTLAALQDAARAYVALFPDLLKIGITGSSGKTTTKEIVASIFSRKFNVVMNEGNLNSETGLPLSVFRIRKEHEVGVFELGMNRKGEISEIAGVLSPDLALITNIGTAHIGILGTQQAIAEEKKQIFSFFTDTSTGFVPEDEQWREFLSKTASGTVRPFGPTTTEGFEGSEDLGIDGTLIRYRGLDIHLSLPGSYNLKNALGAIALADHAGISAGQIRDGIESVQPLFGRGQVVHSEITVLVDCYNANPDSMESAIDFCNSLEWKGKMIFVLGSMLELGDESEKAHLEICRLVARSRADSVFLFGKDMVEAGHAVDWNGRETHLFEDDMASMCSLLSVSAHPGDLVFIKGSRGMALERVLPFLEGAGKTGVPHG